MNEAKILDNATALGKKTSSTKILKKSIEILKFSKENVVRKMLFMLLQCIISYNISVSLDTVTITKNILEMLNGIVIALFAVVFTGYALFQALINDRLLIYMIEEQPVKNLDKSSYLEESNYYFVQLMMIQFIVMVINLFICLILFIVPNDWSIFSESNINEILCSIGLFIVVGLNFEAIWETKSFVFNMFQLFNIHAMSRTIDFLNQNDRK